MEQKVYVTSTLMATFSCPACGKTRQADVTRYCSQTRAVRLKCKCTCSHVYTVFLERRRHARKQCDLEGAIIKGNHKGICRVIDISRSGLKLNVGSNKGFKPGETLDIKFFLDDPGRSRVEKTVIVRSVSEPFIGVEFLSHEHYDKFGTYLLYYF